VSGTAGAGKSGLAVHFVDVAYRRGERAIYFVFEDSSNQILRNMRSIRADLATKDGFGLGHTQTVCAAFVGGRADTRFAAGVCQPRLIALALGRSACLKKTMQETTQAFAQANANYVLRLCITGASPKSLRATAAIKKIREEHLEGDYELKVVDL
jgi:hypothetical protein